MRCNGTKYVYESDFVSSLDTSYSNSYMYHEFGSHTRYGGHDPIHLIIRLYIDPRET
jgi:hypothetical protein